MRRGTYSTTGGATSTLILHPVTDCDSYSAKALDPSPARDESYPYVVDASGTLTSSRIHERLDEPAPSHASFQRVTRLCSPNQTRCPAKHERPLRIARSTNCGCAEAANGPADADAVPVRCPEADARRGHGSLLS